MALGKITYQKVSLKYGILVGLAHIVYFLIMSALRLTHMVELSFLSSIFLVIGIIVAISKYKRAKQGMINYLQGLAMGVIVGVVSSTILALFLVLYINLFDATYLAHLQSSALFPEALSLLALFALTIIYGTWPGFFIAFIAMQWYKRADHTVAERI